ncbi:MAG: HDOD domain-containing protein [Planctomycetes bacterium]|nr:HDOD domain-containing protein [Planctomycetota bacterium]
MSNLRARQLLSNKNITIPTLPAVVQKVQRMLEDPNTGAKEIGKLVASDAPIAAKVLKIANSAYYGLRERCLAPEHASAVLGVRVLRNVVTQAAVISKYDHLKGSVFDLTGLWKHSILVAQSCNFLGKRCKAMIGLSADELYVCGLLHDLGQVVLLDCMQKDYLDVVAYAREKNLPLHAAEQERLGFGHTDVGNIVAQQWGLPAQVGTAILNHHASPDVLASDPVASLVANVNLVVHRVVEGNLGAAATVIDANTIHQLGLRPTDVTELVEFVDKAKASVVV